MKKKIIIISVALIGVVMALNSNSWAQREKGGAGRPDRGGRFEKFNPPGHRDVDRHRVRERDPRRHTRRDFHRPGPRFNDKFHKRDHHRPEQQVPRHAARHRNERAGCGGRLEVPAGTSSTLRETDPVASEGAGTRVLRRPDACGEPDVQHLGVPVGAGVLAGIVVGERPAGQNQRQDGSGRH